MNETEKRSLRIIDITEGTSVDGPGLRTSIYFSGCSHHCEGCHNPQSWAADAGRDIDEDELLRLIRFNGFGVTFSGGDPFFQAEGVAHLARRIKSEVTDHSGNPLSIWCYTGYTWEQVCNDERFLPLLRTIDVLVDSPFVLSQRNTELRFRGSDNQRIIDVQASLAQGSMVDITSQF